MLNVTEIVQSSGWKKFMAKLYGWGASVVLLGALFKIQHWPLAGLMLTIGMTTEVIIFFFSAFEPVHEELDWTLVYPELAGISEDEDFVPAQHRRETGGGGGSLGKFDEMLENADITPELFERLGQGLRNLNQTTQNLENISDASQATNQYVDNLQAASESITSLAETYGRSTEDLNESVKGLADSYKSTAQQITDSGQNLSEQVNQTSTEMAETYKNFEESLNQHMDSISGGNQSYGEKLESLNKNLEALNSVYELQLQATNDHLKSSQKVFEGVDAVMSNIEGSVEDTQQYREQVAKLNENLTALNAVYGNMLSAMNVVTNNE